MEFQVLNDILTSTVGRLFSLDRRAVDQEMRQSMTMIPPPNSADWVRVEGRPRLEQAMRRLNIDYSMTGGRDLPSKSLQQLLNQKKKVKNELKVYDQNFKEIFSRQPKRQEKQPMRPLYMYYKKLKQAISTRPPERQPASLSRDEVNNKLVHLRQQRSELRTLLHNFQLDFSRNNNRRIKFHRDIAPVENEYKRYKEVKGEITKLEGFLS